jgi:putative membrane protein
MRHFLILMTIAGLGSMFLYACGGAANVNTRTATNSMSSALNTVANTTSSAVNTMSNAVSRATSSSPESFMEDAAQGGSAEVEMGELAIKNSADPAVKKFGQMMVTDHGAAGKELEALAKKKNVKLPADIGSHQSTYDDLSKLKGAEFDKSYVDEMVRDHEADLKAFEQQAESSTDPEVKAFAEKGVQMIKKHLDAINAIKAKMNK